MAGFDICVTHFGVTEQMWELDDPYSRSYERLYCPKRAKDHAGDHAAMPAYPHLVWQHSRQRRRQ